MGFRFLPYPYLARYQDGTAERLSARQVRYSLLPVSEPEPPFVPEYQQVVPAGFAPALTSASASAEHKFTPDLSTRTGVLVALQHYMPGQWT